MNFNMNLMPFRQHSLTKKRSFLGETSYPQIGTVPRISQTKGPQKTLRRAPNLTNNPAQGRPKKTSNKSAQLRRIPKRAT